MHNLGDLATITHDEKLRVAARDQPAWHAICCRSYRKLEHLGSPPRGPGVLRVLRGRRAVQAY